MQTARMYTKRFPIPRMTRIEHQLDQRGFLGILPIGLGGT